MQETYLQIYNKIDTLKNEETFLVWVGRIATNKTLRFIQKDSKEVLVKEDDSDFIFERASDDKEEFLPEDIMLNKEKKKKIQDIINNLSEEQKITVQYYYLAEMSVSEIAEEMQCSTGTVKSRLNYARKNIKAAVLDTEKREGIKLYSISGFPIFALIFREEVVSAVVPSAVSSSVVKGIGDIVGLKIGESAGLGIVESAKKGIKELIHKILGTTSGKVASGVAVATVVGTVALTQTSTDLYVTSNSIFETWYHSVDNEAYASTEEREFRYLIDDQYLIFQNDDYQLGVYTIEGKEILPFEFDSIYYNELTDGLFKVEKDNRAAYYDKSGNMITDKMYDDVGSVTDGVFWSYDWDSNNYEIYSTDGNKIYNSSFDDIGEIVNGLVAVKKDGKWGVIRDDGKLIVDFLYDEAFLGDGEYIALNEFMIDDTRLTVLDNQGNLVYTKDSAEGLYFYNGYYNGVASLSGNVDLLKWIDLPIKADRSIIFNPTGTDYSVYNEGYDFDLYKNGYFSYYNDKTDKIVLFDSDGNQVATASGFAYSFNRFIVEDNGKCDLIDEDGNLIISGYDDIQVAYKGDYYMCLDNNRYDLYNADGTLLYNNANEIYSIGCEMFECRLDNGTAIVNGQDGSNFMLSADEWIETYYSDGYAVKITSFVEPVKTEYYFTYEIIDKSGNIKHKIKTPDDTDSYTPKVNAKVLKEGIYSYEHEDEGKCYIKTW